MPVIMSAGPNERVPDVSVVVPVYNAAEYLRETIDSILAQDIGLSRLQIVAVDDGSTDESLAILREYESQYDQVRVFSMPNSGSSAAPRNLGIDNAHGRYVFFMDSDDRIEPYALGAGIDVADRTGNRIVLLKMEIFGVKGRKAPTRAFHNSHLNEDFIDSEAYRTLSALKLFDRELIAELGLRFQEGHRVGEDIPFTLRAYLHAPKVSVLSDRVYYWVRNREDGSNLTAIGQSVREEALKIRNYLAVLSENEISSERLKVLLQRPVNARSGMRKVFGKQFVVELDKDERRRTLHEIQQALAPFVPHVPREEGTVETQIIFDLVVAGDLAALEQFSASLSDAPDPMLAPALDGSGFVYRTSTGQEISDLNLVMVFELLELEISLAEIRFRTEVGSRGVSVPPTSTRFLWKHRKSGNEIEASVEQDSAYGTAGGGRAIMTARTPFSAMNLPGPWDAFIELRWDECTYRRRFGSSHSAGVDTSSRAVDNPVRAVAYFTEHGNVTVDQGPVGTHKNARPLFVRPEATLSLINRRRVLAIAGIPPSVSNIVVAGRGKEMEIRPVLAAGNVSLAEAPKWTTEVQFRDSSGTILWRTEVAG